MDIPELLAIFGPGIAGAVFGAGWWFWVDAVVCSSIAVSFVHYLPGLFASLAALMFNCVRKEDIDYSPYDEGEWSLVELQASVTKWVLHAALQWIETLAFSCLCISFVSLAASVGLLIQDALTPSGPSAWTGVAGVLQCVFVLIRLVLFI
ncbi:Transmembrane protein 50-like protein [Bienertia sinuspersici]